MKDKNKEHDDFLALKEKVRLRVIKREEKVLRMNSVGSFKRAFIWLQYHWLDIITLFITSIITSCFLGVIGKISFEIWKVIFNVNL